MDFPRKLYHPVHGTLRVESEYDMPDVKLGWFTHPREAAEAMQALPKEFDVPRAVAVKPVRPRSADDDVRSPSPDLPDPMAFEDFDSYMEAFVDTLDRGLAPAVKAKEKSRAMDHWAMVRYQASLTGRKLEERADEARALAE